MVEGFKSDVRQADTVQIQQAGSRLTSLSDIDNTSTGRRCARLLAAELGLSERHLRRLRKLSSTATPRTKSTVRLTTELLGRLGYADLLGTVAHRYLSTFLAEFVPLLSDHLSSGEALLDERWAKGSAHQTINRIKEAAQRRKERLEQEAEMT